MNIFEATAKLTLDTSGFMKSIRTVQDTKSGISSFFQKISGAADTAKNGISIFGDVLKANLASEAITKGFDTIASEFEKIGSAATNFVKNSVSVGEMFDSAMSQVYATMGDKASEAVEYNGEMMQSSEALRKFAKEMGATTKFSATESAQALNYMALAGYNAEEAMSMLPNVMNLASAGAFDLQRASDMLTDTQTAFGITFERTNQLVDEMAAAASNSNTSVAQLGDAFLTVGGLAKELNGGFVTLANGVTKPVDGIQELEIALGAMANAGIKGSEAGTHMRNLLMKLSSPTDDAKKLFEDLGISVFDASGNMKSLRDVFSEMQDAFAGMNNQQKKLEAISEIFNARDTASATALLAAVEQSWDSLGGAILNADGAAAKMAETQLNNLAGAKTIMKSALEGLQINISDAVNPFITPFVKFAGESLQAFSNTIEKEGVENLRGTISKVVTNAGVLIYKNVPKFMKNLVKVLTIIKNGIADGIPDFMDYMRATIATVAQDMEKELPEFIKAGQRITSEIGKGLIKNLPYLVRAVSNLSKKVSKSITSNLPVIIPAVTSGILTIIDELTKPERITDFINAGIELVVGLANGIGQSASIVIEKVPEIVENLKQGFSDNKDKLKGTAGTILSAITDGIGEISFSDTVDNIITGLSNALDSEEWKSVKEKISNGIQNIDFSEITSNLSKLIIGVTDSAGKLIDGIDWTVLGGAIGEALNGVDWYGILDSTFKVITTAIKNAPELLKGIAETIDSETATQIATIGINLLMGKQIVGGIATYISSTAAFTTVSTALSGLLTKCTPVIGAAIVGWDIGTLIRNELLSEETISKIDEGVYQVVDVFKDMGYRIKATFKSIESIFDANSPYREMTQDQIYKSIALEETASGTGFQSRGFANQVLSWGEDLTANFGEGVSKSKDIENAIQDKLNWIHDNMGFSEPKEGVLSDFHTYAPDMVQLFADGVQKNTYLVKDKISDLGENIKENIYSTIDTAVLWGSDMIDNFINGINQKWNDAVSTVANFAGMIASYIGFSEPEKGALSRFHTFAPDMMKLFAQGIRENKNFVMSQAETLAGNLANTFQKPIMPVIETTFSEIKTPEMPEFENQSHSVEIKFIDNLDIIIEKIRNLTDKALHVDTETSLTQVQSIVNPEYHLPELPDLILKADTSIIDKIKEVLENPLVLSVRIADGFENVMDMFASKTLFVPEMGNVRPYSNSRDYIRQIEGIRNSYSTTNNYYQASRAFTSESKSNYTTVQNMTINVPDININSSDDMDALADRLISRIAERLDAKAIRDNRGTGGTGWL